MRKIITRPILGFTAAVCVGLCCGARLYGVSPFGAAAFVAFSPYAFVLLAPVYILCSYLFTFEVWRIYVSALTVFIAIVRHVLALKFPSMRSRRAVRAFSLAAVCSGYFLSFAFLPPATAAIGLFVGLAFFYFARIFAGCASKNFSFKPSAIECAATCVMVFAAGLTFSRAATGRFNAGLAFAFFAALALGLTDVKLLLGGAVALALGLSFGFGLPTAFAFLLAAASTAVFSAMPRVVYGSVGLGVFAALSVVLGVSPVAVGWNTLMSAAGVGLFCLFPSRSLAAVRSYFDYEGSAQLATRHFINRTRADSANKMLCLAKIFDETARLMGCIRDGTPDPSAAARALSDRFCPYCSECGACGSERQITDAFTRLCVVAQNGGTVIAEMPEFFGSRCVRASEVVAAATELSDAAKRRARELAGEKKARALVIERMNAVSDVLTKLGNSQSLPVGFDGGAEKRLCAELALYGIECAQSFVTSDNVTVVVRTAPSQRTGISRAVSACMKKKYELISLDKTQAAGWSVGTLVPKTSFEAVYARAGVSKNGGVSGDSYTFERIGGRFLTALADGMGSGEKAGLDSEAAVELIECFYRAGFDSDAALAGVNRFLKVGSESYSAADVAVCDLESGETDIIKIGSPPCYIKTADTVLKIEGSSLPIGVLDEMRPFSVRRKMAAGQMLVLCSDGVSDCFDGDGLAELINGLTALNPEKTAKTILSRALETTGGVPRDDMTVICFRLYSSDKKRAAVSFPRADFEPNAIGAA